MPKGYVDEATGQTLLEFRERALKDRRPEMLQRFPVQFAADKVARTWQDSAIQLYRNRLARRARREG